MQTLIDDKRDNHWQNKLKMTKHFIERYHERVWHTTPPASYYWKKMIETILLDIDERLLDREKTLLETFIDSNHLELPFDRYFLLIIKNKKLVTVYK